MTFTQRNFSLGEVRDGFLEADDLEIRQQSCRGAENMRVTATRTLRSRGGFDYVRTMENPYDLIELRPTTGSVFGLIINDTSIEIVDATGQSVFTSSSVVWTDASTVWVEPFRDETLIGCEFGILTLSYNDGAWALDAFEFSNASSGTIAQPYWVFRKDIDMRPSARSGAITVVSSAAFFTPAYVGQRIRYGGREILITGYTSPTSVSGTVISELPPSFRLSFPSTAGFLVGEAIVGATTGFTGVISAMTSTTLDVVTKTFFDGPDPAEKISGPSTTATLTAKYPMPPLASNIWDEQLMSPVRGYPRAGASAGGRMAFTDFPLVPDLICMSSSRSIYDFEVGADDDDAITRQVGDNAPRFMHIINAGDLLLFSDRGLYYISIRDSSILTPSTFNPVLFDKRASSPVRPVSVGDGVVFVEASGQSIAACLLDGNIYLKWSVRTISIYHNHQIKSPIKLCGPSQFSETPEKYLFVVNADGTLAAVSWNTDFGSDSVGFIPWSTQGSFKTISPIFGGYWAIIERSIAGVPKIFLERMNENSMLDCGIEVNSELAIEVNGLPLTINGSPLVIARAAADPLAGETVHIYGGGYYGGTRDVQISGELLDMEDMPAETYAGFNFLASAMPWPMENVQTARSGMLKARLIRGSISVLSSAGFSIRANRSTRAFGGYAFGDPTDAPPPLKTRVYKFSVVGQRDHPEIEFIKTEPGPFQILAITQEVQV